MYSLRRWWERYGIQAALVAIVIAGAWMIKETQGALIFEIFRGVTRPLELGYSPEEQLEKAKMLAGSDKITELQEENQRLKSLLGYVSKQKNEGIAAPVIGRSADHWWQQMILGRGSSDGIKKGDIVTGAGGLVGRVESTSVNTSRVILISDPTVRVGVTISRSRNMGFIRGQEASRVVMEFFDKVPDVRKGDVVMTSTVSELFPPGIPVGKVESVNLGKSPAPEAIIELSVPMNVLEWVFVSPNKPAPEIVTPLSGIQPKANDGKQIYPDNQLDTQLETQPTPTPNNDAPSQTPPDSTKTTN